MAGSSLRFAPPGARTRSKIGTGLQSGAGQFSCPQAGQSMGPTRQLPESLCRAREADWKAIATRRSPGREPGPAGGSPLPGAAPGVALEAGPRGASLPDLSSSARSAGSFPIFPFSISSRDDISRNQVEVVGDTSGTALAPARAARSVVVARRSASSLELRLTRAFGSCSKPSEKNATCAKMSRGMSLNPVCGEPFRFLRTQATRTVRRPTRDPEKGASRAR
jgi:hypothetical protein